MLPLSPASLPGSQPELGRLERRFITQTSLGARQKKPFEVLGHGSTIQFTPWNGRQMVIQRTIHFAWNIMERESECQHLGHTGRKLSRPSTKETSLLWPWDMRHMAEHGNSPGTAFSSWPTRNVHEVADTNQFLHQEIGWPSVHGHSCFTSYHSDAFGGSPGRRVGLANL